MAARSMPRSTRVSGSSTKQAPAAWTLLTGASSPTTPWVISGGVLTAGNTTNVFGATSLITVNAPGTLDLGGFSQTIGSLTGSGTVTNSGATFPATLTTGGDNTSTTFSGTIQNGNSTLSLTKEGTGVFTLSGTNTYTGATTVNAGTLALTGNGSIAPSSVNVANAGSFFDISGTTSGAGITSLSGVAGGWVILGGKTSTLSNASGSFDGAIGGAGGGTGADSGLRDAHRTNTYTESTTDQRLYAAGQRLDCPLGCVREFRRHARRHRHGGQRHRARRRDPRARPNGRAGIAGGVGQSRFRIGRDLSGQCDVGECARPPTSAASRR